MVTGEVRKFGLMI